MSMAGTGAMSFVKTVNVTEDHITDSTGNGVYWYDYCGISPANDPNAVYLLFFENNDTGSRYVNMILYRYETDILGISSRNNWTNTAGQIGQQVLIQRSLYAKQGTKIKIYRYKQET